MPGAVEPVQGAHLKTFVKATVGPAVAFFNDVKTIISRAEQEQGACRRPGSSSL
jgi:hypothetical protein